MPGKINQKRKPEFTILRRTNLGIHKFHSIRSLIVITERQLPGDHGVTIDFPVNTHRQSKFHPLIKHRIIVFPTAIQFFHPHHHGFKRIFRLTAPRLMHNRSGNTFLAGIRQLLHHRPHRLKMSLTPQRHLIITGHSIRILPHIQPKSPVPRGRQNPFIHFQLYIQRSKLSVFTFKAQFSPVHSALSIRRRPDIQPYRLRMTGLQILHRLYIQNISHHRRIKNSMIRPVPTASLLIFIQLICHHIPDKMSPHR